MQIELQLRHALLGKTDGALRSGDDIRQPHFAAAGDAGGFNDALRPAREAHHRVGLILVFDGDHL